MDPSGILGLSFGGVGALSLLLALFFFMRTRRFLRDAVATTGLVTGLAANSGGDGGTTYQPVVQFTTQEGQTVQFTEGFSSNPPRFHPGQTVPVRYSPTNPHRARIDRPLNLWFLPVFFTGFAVIFGGVGVWQLLSSSGGVEAAEGASLPGTVTTPGGVVATIVTPPSETGGGSVLTVQEGGTPPSVLQATCQSIRDRGKRRQVRLAWDGGALTFTANPYTGPNAYQPGSNLDLGGTLFDGDVPSGVVVFDGTGRAGAVNLTGSTTTVTGAWSCRGLQKP